MVLISRPSPLVPGEFQTHEQRTPIHFAKSEMEFIYCTEDEISACNIGEFTLFFPFYTVGPQFMGLDLKALPDEFMTERFFQSFFELLCPPVVAKEVPHLRPHLAGAFSGQPTKVDPKKIEIVSYLRRILIIFRIV